MKYKVRDNFVVKVGRDVFKGGEVVELNEQQAADYANIIELAEHAAEKHAHKPRAKKAEAHTDAA